MFRSRVLLYEHVTHKSIILFRYFTSKLEFYFFTSR